MHVPSAEAVEFALHVRFDIKFEGPEMSGEDGARSQSIAILCGLAEVPEI